MSQSEEEIMRRHFLELCGKLALYTPPTLALLLASTQDAIAQSTGGAVPDGMVVDSVDGQADG